MSNRISPEHMAEIKAMTRGVLPSQLLEHIAALEAENERLHDLACADWFRCPVPQLTEAHDALKAEVERLRAVEYEAMVMLDRMYPELYQTPPHLRPLRSALLRAERDRERE